MSTPMQCGPWTLRAEPSPDGKCFSLEISDVNTLPSVLRELAEMGFDLSASAKVLQEVEEEQRQRKEAETLKAKLKEKAEQGAESPKARRFTLACAKKSALNDCVVSEGVEWYKGGRVTLRNPYLPGGDQASTLQVLISHLEAIGYECLVEYID